MIVNYDSFDTIYYNLIINNTHTVLSLDHCI